VFNNDEPRDEREKHDPDFTPITKDKVPDPGSSFLTTGKATCKDPCI
jgi:hypothetical protein